MLEVHFLLLLQMFNAKGTLVIFSSSIQLILGYPFRWIETYAGDQLKFFEDFTSAYIKLVNTGASWKAS
jgi:hypothetical protein